MEEPADAVCGRGSLSSCGRIFHVVLFFSCQLGLKLFCHLRWRVEVLRGTCWICACCLAAMCFSRLRGCGREAMHSHCSAWFVNFFVTLEDTPH